MEAEFLTLGQVVCLPVCVLFALPASRLNQLELPVVVVVFAGLCQ